jgi:L-amino acid N-acyltransferase YncA
MLTKLIDHARRQGLRRLVGITLSENEAMLRLARRLGFGVALDRNSPTVTNLALDLDPS